MKNLTHNEVDKEDGIEKIGELNKKEAYRALINNNLNWYVVQYTDGSCDLKHSTMLSSILECGEDPEKWDIETIERCWNGDELGENPFE